MGISYSTARYLAPASFVYDFAAQQYGMLSTPNMKTIHDANLSFFSPQPFMIAGFFAPQQLVQLAWLYRLWKLDPSKSAADKKELDQIVDYVPYYALGNVCIGTWMFFWNGGHLKAANAFVVVNTSAQLFYMISKLPPLNTRSPSSYLTHLVSKTFAGIGVLDILHNTSVAYFRDAPATTLIKALTGGGFALAAAFSDWIFGGCLVYDLVALSVGQKDVQASGDGWAGLLAVYAVGVAGIVGVRNFFMPPYESKPLAGGYDAVSGEERDDDDDDGGVQRV